MSVIILATFKAKADKLDTVLEHVRTLRDHAANKEPGTITYTPAQDPEDELKFTIWEEYESEAAVQAHLEFPPFVAFKAAFGELADGELGVAKYNKVQ